MFQHRASRVFAYLEFNFQLSNEEAEEYVYEAEADSGSEVLFGPPNCAPLPDDLQVIPKASSPALPAGTLPFNPSTSVNPGPTSGP